MQNILRFALASYVVFFHIGSYYFPNAGPFAVFGFYTLSGFLITKVLNEVYYKKQHAMRDFFLNRFWRLYPTYFIAALLGLMLAIHAADSAAYWNTGIRLPDTASGKGFGEWLWFIPNITIIGLHFGIPFSSPIRFAPPSWTTAIEIYFYIFLFFWGARSERFVRLWLKASVSIVILITIYFLSVGSQQGHPILTPERLIYGNVFAVSFCFVLGSFGYFARRSLNNRTNSKIGYLAFAAVLIFPLVPWGYLVPSKFGLMLLLYLESAAVMLFLMHACGRDLEIKSRILGDLSYPLFLVHWQVAILLAALGIPVIKQDITSVIVVYLVSVLAAFIATASIEAPLKKIRARIRTRT